MYDISTLKEKKISELQDIAKSLKLKKVASLKKQELIYQIIDYLSTNPESSSNTKTIEKIINKISTDESKSTLLIKK